jgi:CPA2 family monovalent cation:H+ antiporter-2/glutathione-regulated potassium-efflux system protein KefB
MAPLEGSLLHIATLFLGASVIAVVLFKRLGLGSVLGYLAAGAVIGPFGLGLISDPETVLHFAEFGVVLLLFIIGLELRPKRLWVMRREIFGLGLAQVVITGALLTGVLMFSGLSFPTALVAGSGLALSSTAFALQILEERGALNTPYGTTAFSILLFQDLAIVPLLAMVAFLAPGAEGETAGGWLPVAKTVGAVVGVVLIGRYLLTPAFRIVALTRANEIFTAAALLLVIGASLIMEAVGLSMALGAFLVGVMLADSEYRHQLETEIEPIRGILLGLFFIAVGMSVDWPLVFDNIVVVLAGVIGLLFVKGAVIYGLCRLFGVEGENARRVAVTIPQGGEFAFVLFGVAASAAVMATQTANLLTAVVTLSMAATPLIGVLYNMLLRKLSAGRSIDVEGVEHAERRSVIIAGFGRMGQIVAQLMNARGIDVTAIDNDPTRIEIAKKYGNKVYFGDVRRSDVLATAGTGEAQMIFVCVDDKEACNQAIKHIRAAFPSIQIMARAYDRNHVLELMQQDVDWLVRETFESSVAMGKEGLRRLDVDPAVIETIEEEYRHRDEARFLVQEAEGEFAGVDKVFTSYVVDDNDHEKPTETREEPDPADRTS